MKNLLHLLLTILLTIAASEARAVTRSWTNSVGGTWFIAANWSPN